MLPASSTTIPPHREPDAKGRAQAEAAAEKLRAVRFTHAYASEFVRAQQTAAVYCAPRLPVRIDPASTSAIPAWMGCRLMSLAIWCVPTGCASSRRGRIIPGRDGTPARLLDEIAARHPHGTVLACPTKPHPRRAGLDYGRPEQISNHDEIANCEW